MLCISKTETIILYRKKCQKHYHSMCNLLDELKKHSTTKKQIVQK